MNMPGSDNSPRSATQANYDRLSRWYDLLAGSAERKCKQKGLDLLDARPGETILEIGFGTGQCLQAIAQSVGDRGKVYGIDLSAGMLQVAQNRLHRAGLLHRVELRRGNALPLPFPEALFDALYLSFTLELFSIREISSVLSECQRVLHPGGRLCVVSMAKKESEGWMEKLYGWAHHRWPVYIDCRPIQAHIEIALAGFHLDSLVEMSLFGLPVSITLAHK